MPTLTTSVQYSTRNPNNSNWAKKEIQDIKIRKEEVKLSVHR